MGSPDTAVRGYHRKTVVLTSRSYDPMEYASNFNIHYQEQFDIEKTRPLYKGAGKNDIRNSMLAYTNYVSQRQKRNQLFNSTRNTLLDQRRHTLEVNDNLEVQAKHIPHYSKLGQQQSQETQSAVGYSSNNNNSNSISSKIPVLKRDKVLKFQFPKSADNSNHGLSRDNTFPPLVINSDYGVHSQKVVLTSRTEPTSGYRESVNTEQKYNHGELGSQQETKQAWDENSEMVNLSITGTENNRKARVKQKTLGNTKYTPYPQELSDDNDKNVEKTQSDMDSHHKINEATEDELKQKRKQYSEKLLKSAIETLKTMEKEIDLNRKKGAKFVDNSKTKKVKIKIKKMKRLKMPKQKLDIIPELDCEYSFTSDEEIGSMHKLERNGSKIRRSKKKRLQLNPIEESSDEESDMYSTESEHSETDEKSRYQRNTDYSENGYHILPPINQQLTNQKPLSPSKTNKSKAKLDIKNRLKKKNNRLLFLQPQTF